MENVQASNPFQPPERRRGGGLRRFLFFLITFLLVMSLMRSCQPPPSPPPIEPSPPLPRNLEPDSTQWPPPVEKQPQRPMEGDSDWSMEEVEVEKPAATDGGPDDGVILMIPKSPQPAGSKKPAGPEPSETKRTEKGDWSIEEVESDGSTPPSATTVEGASSKQEGETKKPDPPKKTTKGDWEIEEVR